MTEKRPDYQVQSATNHDILTTETDALRVQLRNVKRDLIALLLTVERALGDEPSVRTRAERRQR